ncbi:MAG: CrcB family protein [Myxococcota bacterium]
MLSVIFRLDLPPIAFRRHLRRFVKWTQDTLGQANPQKGCYALKVQLLWIACGGALGTLLRYGLGRWCAEALGSTFPLGTLIVNVLGAGLLGVISELIGDRSGAADPQWANISWYGVLGTGMMGGFTTYSSFNLETLRLFEASPARAAAYVGLTLSLGFVAGLTGIQLGRRLMAL